MIFNFDNPRAVQINSRRAMIFDLGYCDCCGGQVQEANAIGARVDKEWLIHHGVGIVEKLPPEVIVLDDGNYGCERCDGVSTALAV